MLKKLILGAAALTASLLIASPSFADGGPRHYRDRHFHHHQHQWKHYHRPARPVVVMPPPRVYYTPPAPVYYAPPPRPVYYPPVPHSGVSIRLHFPL